MTHIITATRLYWPVYYPEARFSKYSLSILRDDVPDNLADYVTPMPVKTRTLINNPELDGKIMCRFNQPFKPRLTFTNRMDGLRQFDELQRLANLANIPQERLLHKIPALLAVNTVERLEGVEFRGQKPRQVKELQIVAVQVGIGELRDNFERLLTEYFP